MNARAIVSASFVAASLAVGLAVSLVRVEAQRGGSQVAIDADDIGGVVASAKGREAGVWVIAETTDLPTKFARIVVTDDQGRYVMPDLPKATYRVWVRGYGLIDSLPVKAAPGKLLDLRAVVAPNPHAAAEYYPANYWYALLQVPPKSAFPLKTKESPRSTAGGAADPTAEFSRGRATADQQAWINTMKMGSVLVWQMGNKPTREIPEKLRKGSDEEQWNALLKSGESPVSEGQIRQLGGAEHGLKMYVDWTRRIAGGEYPTEAPPRPQGIERNLVISEWAWSDAKGFVHDEIATDKRNPTVNANGPVFGVEQHSADVVTILDPNRHTTTRVNHPVLDPKMPINWEQGGRHKAPLTWGDEIVRSGKASLHNPMLDHKGRLWITAQIRMGQNQPAFCTAGSSHPSAKLFPIEKNVAEGDQYGRELSVYDWKAKQFTLVDTCYGTHHLFFAEDADHTLWTSGGHDVVGAFSVKVFDETGDVAKAQRWYPYVLDTNANGKLDAWVEPGQAGDPGKDKRIHGATYGLGTNPADGSIWGAELGVPGAILRTDPATGLTEKYEPPLINPASPGEGYQGYNPKGIDVDRKGLIWVSMASSGHVASFDRGKCKVLNGPTATGQHCPEGWTFYAMPGPNFKGVTDSGSADFPYLQWVDQFDTLGLGKDVPLVPGTNSDSVLALLPDTKKWVILRVPYPLGFYMRGFDGRIDDPNAGWKGKAVWSAYATVMPWHIEGGKGAQSRVVKLQLRPNPLAR